MTSEHNKMDENRQPKAMALEVGFVYRIACNAFKKIADDKKDLEGGNDDALIAIVFAAFSIEAFLNETIERLHEARTKRCDEFLDVVKVCDSKISVVETYYLFQCILRGTEYDRGSAPFQDIQALFEIRNEIAHKKPQLLVPSYDEGVLHLETASHAKEERLANVKILAPHPGKDNLSGFIHRIATRAAAKWACETALAAMNEIADCLTDESAGEWLRMTVRSYVQSLSKSLVKVPDAGV